MSHKDKNSTSEEDKNSMYEEDIDIIIKKKIWILCLKNKNNTKGMLKRISRDKKNSNIIIIFQ